MVSNARLVVVMYHYVRDLSTTKFPRLKALTTERFRRQVRQLANDYEMASIESALEFLAGRYRPTRDLCLLTFDDGFKEHITEVIPFLADQRIQGLFFIPTACLEGKVASVHKNHFLMASMGFEAYRARFLKRFVSAAPSASLEVSPVASEQTYRWDAPEVARFKYLMNFKLAPQLRDRILDEVFEERFGDEANFAHELYMNWDEAREMQTAGMVGGHAHTHVALPTQAESVQRQEVETCLRALRAHLKPQVLWPFSYPYGSHNAAVAQLVRDFGFGCAFTTEAGPNEVGADLFRLRRFDTNDIVEVSPSTTAVGSGHAL